MNAAEWCILVGLPAVAFVAFVALVSGRYR